MKRLTAILLSIALLALCACGAKNERASSAKPTASPPPTVSAAENEAGYIIPSAWTENSVNGGAWGYVTATAELPGEGFCDISHVQEGYLVQKDRDQDTAVTTLTQYALDGTALHQVEVPPLKPPAEDIHQYVGYACFGEDRLWVTAECLVVLDDETGETEDQGQLQQWDYDGNLLASVPLSDLIGSQEEFLSDLTLDPAGNPMLIVGQKVLFCDSQGQIAATAELTSNGCSFCQDASGRTYIYDLFENQLYTVNWDSHALGDVVLTTQGLESVLPGGGDYDFFLKSDSLLRGVTLSTGTITEILSWSDWDLAGNVGNLACLDEDTFLILVHSLISDSELLTFTRVPADQIPEKAPVRLAVPLSEIAVEYGGTWVTEIDQMLTEGLNQFNRGSSEYRVEVETYASAEELNLMLVSGDIPDLLFFDQGSLEQDPSIPLLAKKGYLADLEPLFDADPELSTGDFIPSILELAKDQAGGLYAMPLEFYFTALFARTEYVGDRTSWTISDMLSIAQTLPEDMCLWNYMNQRDLLDTVLRSCISDFIDINAGTCDFENQSFYDLLTLCRDYCPAETGEDYSIPSGGSLVTGEGGFGTATMFYKEYVSTAADQGRTLVGYPNTDGGVSIQLYSQISIMAQAPNPDGAWAFFRTLFTYAHQSNRAPSVRLDAFDQRESRVVSNGNATEAESQAARELILSASTQRLMSYPCADIIQEEAAACFAGDKSPQEVARIIQNRVEIYLGEQS